MSAQRFRKKPVEIEAWQVDVFDVPNCSALTRWCGGRSVDIEQHVIAIDTLEGTMYADNGDYVIREPFPTDDRKFYPCKPDIFEATYETVEA